MRLDHLLSKEHLKLLCSSTVLDARFPGVKPAAKAYVLRRVLMGGISMNRFFRVSSGSVSTPPWGLESGFGVMVRGLSFGTLLGPEATGSVVSGFPAHAGDRVWFPLWGVPAWWMGVTGLLFENYIVDASILKIIKCNFR